MRPKDGTLVHVCTACVMWRTYKRSSYLHNHLQVHYCIIMKYVQRIRQHIYHSGLAVLILYFNFFIPCLAVLVWIHVIMWWKVKNSTTRACMEGVVWVYPTAVTKEDIRRHRTKTKGWWSKVSRRCGLPIEGQD